MIREKEYKELTNDLKTIKELTRKSRNIEKLWSKRNCKKRNKKAF